MRILILGAVRVGNAIHPSVLRQAGAEDADMRIGLVLRARFEFWHQ